MKTLREALTGQTQTRQEQRREPDVLELTDEDLTLIGGGARKSSIPFPPHP